nr:immunoglobulin heavy chain junction region [Mus musculus]
CARNGKDYAMDYW